MNEAIKQLAQQLYGHDADAILALDAQERAEAIDAAVAS
jgi:hypothetical protein